MRWYFFGAPLLVLLSAAVHAEKTPEMLPCPSGASDAQCNPSAHDLKEAKAAFSRGLKIQQKMPDQAFQEFEHAAQLAPRNVEYITARELARQQLVSKYIQRGNQELEAGKQVEAL